MPRFALYGDLDFRRLTNAEGAALALPSMVLGDDLECEFRFLEHVEDGVREKQVKVRSVKASIGFTMTPPTDGTFTLYFGGSQAHASTAIAFGASADDFQTAIAAGVTGAGLTLVGSVSKPADGCYIMRLSGGTPANVGLVDDSNLLGPESFVRIRPYQEHGTWLHEIRLIQAPLAFNTGFTRNLPPAPSVRQISEGVPESTGVPAINEIQALTVDPAFRGTFFLRWNLRRSKILSQDDGPDAIASALNAMYTDGAKRFAVSNPSLGEAYIEFIGDLAGQAQEEMTVEVDTFAPGVVTFLLPLDRAAMCTALRAVATITPSFEIEVKYVEDDEDVDDEDTVSKTFTAIQQSVTVVREQIWDELETVQPTDWLRPPQPVSYVPFTPDQVITGVQHYTSSFGDGSSLTYSFTHNLATYAGHVTVRENISNGRVLGMPGEYNIHFPTINSLVLTMAVAPSSNGLAVTFSTAGPASAFQAHTHTIAQIVDLRDELDAIEARLTNVEDKLPFVNPSAPADETTPLSIPIASKFEVFPGRFPVGVSFAEGKPPVKLGALLPAIHKVVIDNLTDPLPVASAHKGHVYVNTDSDPVFIPGGGGRKGSFIKYGEWAGSDGRYLYPLSREGTTKSYYPRDFERVLFVLPVNDKMLRPGMALTLDFKLLTQLLSATTTAEWLLVLETGAITSETTPSPIGVNLKDVTWNTTPLLTQKIILSDVAETGFFGAAVLRSAGDVITANRLLYGKWESAGDGKPDAANFVIRAKLIEFDIEDDVIGAMGAVFYAFTEGTASFGT